MDTWTETGPLPTSRGITMSDAEPTTSVRERGAWYEARYASGGSPAFGRPPRESRLRLEQLTQPVGGRVLDVGCGTGFFLAALHLSGVTPTGVDLSLRATRIARGTTPTALVAVADGERLPFAAGSFEALTCWGTLEHHADMRRALLEFHRVTKEGAEILIRVPNSRFWVDRWRERLGLRAGTEQSELLEHRLSLGEWSALFRSCSFSISDVTADDWFLKARFRDERAWQGKFRLLLRKLALRLSSLESTYSFDFVLRR